MDMMNEKEMKKKREKMMHEFKMGEMNIGKSDKKVKSRRQAIAIMMNITKGKK
jgi:hypothetical protein